jgi:hypothetical protein
MQQTSCITLTIDTVLSLASTHDRGRPSKAEELEIKRTLQPYFAKSHSATFASQKTGYNIKTVTKYYSKFKQEILESETPDFIQRCMEEKEKTLYAYDTLIDSLYDDITDVEHLIEVAKQTGDIAQAAKLYGLKLKIKEDIGNYVSAKINLTNTATAGDTAKLIRGNTNDTQSNTMEKIP